MKLLAIAALAAVVVAQGGGGGGGGKMGGGGGGGKMGGGGGGGKMGGGGGGKGGGGGGKGGGATSSELLQGECKAVTLIFARASTEGGNMGGTMGPIVCSGLKRAYPGKVACQGVGQPYTAGLGDNVGPAGTSQAAIGEATRMFTTANTKCPSTVIVFGGYSQGTAVMMNAVKGLPSNIKQKVVGGVLFGYTKNAQMKGSIPNYPKDEVMVFCDETSPGVFGDGVCGGKLNVNAGHMVYLRNGDGQKAVKFLQSKIDPALRGRGG